MKDLIQSGAADDLLPSDLSSSIEKRHLITLVLDVVQSIELTEPKGYREFSSTCALPPRMLMTLLGYCYAIGIYSSEEIELAISRDEHIRYIAARRYPTAQDIRSFRRYHKRSIHETLTLILRRAWEFCWAASASTVSARTADSASIFRSDVNNEQFARLAEQRIQSAIFFDSVALED